MDHLRFSKNILAIEIVGSKTNLVLFKNNLSLRLHENLFELLTIVLSLFLSFHFTRVNSACYLLRNMLRMCSFYLMILETLSAKYFMN